MGGYLIYHPRRQKSVFGSVLVYHDHIGNHNQDPYVWNTQFLHTYCHITQMSPIIGDINFWVSGDTFPDFSHLYCDLVFVVAKKQFWAQANDIARDDKIVDSEESYKDHYRWAKITTVGRCININSKNNGAIHSKPILPVAFNHKTQSTRSLILCRF